jgi:hypothetical protein
LQLPMALTSPMSCGRWVTGRCGWTVRDRDGQQLQQLLAAYTEQLHSAIPQGIANVLWGVAKLQLQVPPG